jgi:hypothetical protein
MPFSIRGLWIVPIFYYFIGIIGYFWPIFWAFFEQFMGTVLKATMAIPSRCTMVTVDRQNSGQGGLYTHTLFFCTDIK